MRLLKWLCLLVLCLFALDALYALYIHAARVLEEKNTVRNEKGVREGCEAFDMGEGEVAILCVHGFGDSPALWKNMAPELVREGYYIRAIRLSGFAGPPGEADGLTSEHWQAQLHRAVEELSAEYDRVWIAAHSLGAAITLSAYPDMPVPVDGLVLFAPLLEVSPKRSPVLSPKTWFRAADAVTVCTRWVQSIFPVDALDPAVRKNHPRQVYIPLTIIRSLFQSELEAWASLGSPFPPVLLLQSEQDRVVDNAASTRFFEQLDSPRKECLVFSDSGHIIPCDRQWREALGSMVAFIQR